MKFNSTNIFIGRLEEAANIFIIIEKKEHTILEFSQNFANVIV